MAALIDEHTVFQDVDGKPIVAGSLYVGIQGLDPKLNPVSIFSNRALTIALANPQTLDAYGRATNKIWVADRYSIKVEDVLGAQQYQELDAGETPASGVTTLTNIQGINAITAEAVPAITAYDDKEIYLFTVASVNTSAVTLDAGGGAIAIKKNHDQDLASGDLEANQVVSVIYNSTDDVFEWTNQNRKTIHGTKGADVASATDLLIGIPGNFFDVTGTTTIATLATKGVGTHVTMHFDGVLTLTHHATNLILPGGADITTAAGDIAVFYEYATADWRCSSYTRAAARPNAGITLVGEVDLTNSGANDLALVTFSAIPAGVRRVTLIVAGISQASAGTSKHKVTIGPVAGVESTGYVGAYGPIGGTAVSQPTTGFEFGSATVNTATYGFKLVFDLENASTNTWSMSSSWGRNDSPSVSIGQGTKSLAGALSVLTLTTANGTDLFDAGVANLTYEF